VPGLFVQLQGLPWWPAAAVCAARARPPLCRAVETWPGCLGRAVPGHARRAFGAASVGRQEQLECALRDPCAAAGAPARSAHRVAPAAQVDAAQTKSKPKAPPADIRRYLKATGLIELRYIRKLSSLCTQTYLIKKLTVRARLLLLQHTPTAGGPWLGLDGAAGAAAGALGAAAL